MTVEPQSPPHPTVDPAPQGTLPRALAEARRMVAELVANNLPAPDDFQEVALLLELAADPFNIAFTRSLVAVRHKLGKPVMPDQSETRTTDRRKRLPPAGIEELLDQGTLLSQSGDLFWDYACLWQVVIRYPQSARGWAEYARRFAERRDWANSRFAIARVFGWENKLERRTVIATLAALKLLALNGQLLDLDWECWFESLPLTLQVHPNAVDLLLWTRRVERAVSSLPSLTRARPPAASRGADRWIAAANIAFEQEQWNDAYGYWRRAFEADLSRALRAVVTEFSARFSWVLRKPGRVDEFADWLTAQSSRFPEVNLIPPLWAPESLHKIRAQRERAIDRGLPSVLFVAQGKTGSTTIGNIFSSGFVLICAIYSLTNQRVIAPWLADYMRGGACYVTHLRPSERNIALLAAGGVKKLIVHTRDPRQILISYASHVDRYAMEVQPSERSKSDRQDTLGTALSGHYREFVDWIDGWVGARDRLSIEFTTFEDFVRDRDRFVERCLDLYGGDRRYFDRVAALTEQPGVDYHRRSGRIDEWREALTRRQIEQINRSIPDRLWKLFGWEP